MTTAYTITVHISDDVSRLGPEATADDLYRYVENLAELLFNEFDVSIRVVAESRSDSCVVADDHDEYSDDQEPAIVSEIERRLEAIESGGEWAILAFGSADGCDDPAPLLVATYTIHATCLGESVDSPETLGESYGVIYTDSDEVESALDDLESDFADGSFIDEDGCCSECGSPADNSSGHGSCDALCHGGTEYGIEEQRHTLELDLDSIAESDDDEYDREYWAGITIGVRHSGHGHHGTWDVGTMVGVRESDQGTAEASGTTRGLITAWQTDPSDLQEVPEHLQHAVLDLLTEHAEAIWQRVVDARDE